MSEWDERLQKQYLFIGASAKALRGIRNLFGTVHIQPRIDGRFNVIVRKIDQ